MNQAVSASGPARERLVNSNLKWRLASAALAIPLLLLVVFGGLGWVIVATLAAAAVATYELARLSGEGGYRRWIIASPALLLPAAGAMVAGRTGNEVQAACLVLAGAGAALSLITGSRAGSGRTGLAVAAAAIYFGVLLAHGPALAARASGKELLLLAIFGTFAVDTSAYFTGRLLGKRRMAPRISPRKTWEGAAGGILGGIAAVAAMNTLFGPGIAVVLAALLGVALAVIAISGDLLESALKRSAVVKDAGSVIPGHGGMLDRIDSLAPCLALVYWAAVGAGV